MNIHIALIGDRPEPVLSGIRASSGVDKIYLLHSDRTQSIARKIRDTLLKMDYNDIFLKIVDAFSMNSIVNTIFKITKEEVGHTFYINITGGTNLMAGAACAASYFVGAHAYYMLHPDKSSGRSTTDLMIILPIPHTKYKELTKLQLDILARLNRRQGPASSTLLIKEGLGISPQCLSYNVKEMAYQGLIDQRYNTSDSRVKLLSLTDVGRLRLSWSR